MVSLKTQKKNLKVGRFNMKKRMSLIKISKSDADRCQELYTTKFSSDLDISKSLDIGQEVAASVSKADIRNLAFHKKLFALLNLAFENLPEKFSDNIKSVDELLQEVKIQVGHREKRISMGGQVYWIPKSIAFDKLGEEAFSDFYNKTLDFVLQFILPDTERADLEKEIVSFL